MWKVLLTIEVACLCLMSCSKVPVTGRRQMNMLPENMLMDMSLTNYSNFLKSHKVVSGSQHAAMVKKTGSRISVAVERYLRKKGGHKRVKGYKWAFNLVQDNTVNAWCMPGGKVVFYTGIMPIAKTETGVAVVMGHEIAHAVARHGNERMSQGLALQMGGIALAVALSQKSKETQALFLSAYGVGSAVGVMLPFSRKHEAEADKMGLVFMALAGYDPREAPKFWQRMKARSKGSPPEFLSTHPNHGTRIKKLNDYMPTALKYYKKK